MRDRTADIERLAGALQSGEQPGWLVNLSRLRLLIAGTLPPGEPVAAAAPGDGVFLWYNDPPPIDEIEHGRRAYATLLYFEAEELPHRCGDHHPQSHALYKLRQPSPWRAERWSEIRATLMAQYVNPMVVWGTRRPEAPSGVVGAFAEADGGATVATIPRSVFVSYAHEDDEHRRMLDRHLSLLKRQGALSVWHDRQLRAGDEWKGRIDAELEAADIVLLLVSVDFIASDYCYDIEMKRALERHASGEARVIPIFVRACDWHGAPFGKLQGVPDPARPISAWADRDAAWTEVAMAIRDAAGAPLDSPRTERVRRPMVDSARPPQNPALELRLLEVEDEIARFEERLRPVRVRYAHNIWPGHAGTYRASNPYAGKDFAMEVGSQHTLPAELAARLLADFSPHFELIDGRRDDLPAPLTNNPGDLSRLPITLADLRRERERLRKVLRL